MPRDFENCISQGGKVRTIKVSGKKYIHVCWDKQGRSHAGEVKTKLKKRK